KDVAGGKEGHLTLRAWSVDRLAVADGGRLDGIQVALREAADQHLGREQALAGPVAIRLELLERDGLLDPEAGNARAAQRRQVGATSQALPDVLGQDPDVGTFRAF